MSHHNVEQAIGRLVTDEGLRRRFAESPDGALRELAECGLALTSCEQRALAQIDSAALNRFAHAIDPRIHKTEP